MTRVTSCCITLFFALTAVFLSGCSAFDEGVGEKVTVYSFPTGATIEVNGEEVGTTPDTITLGTLKTYQVSIKKEGYEPYREIISPERNDWGKSWIRFGLLDDTGFYNELKPDSVLAKLRPDIVPSSRSATPYEDLAVSIAEVDLMFQSGMIDSVEHKYIISHLINFYSEG